MTRSKRVACANNFAYPHAHYKITRYNNLQFCFWPAFFSMVRRQDDSFISHDVVYLICCCMYLKKFRDAFFYPEFQAQCLTIRHISHTENIGFEPIIYLIAAHISKILSAHRELNSVHMIPNHVCYRNTLHREWQVKLVGNYIFIKPSCNSQWQLLHISMHFFASSIAAYFPLL